MRTVAVLLTLIGVAYAGPTVTSLTTGQVIQRSGSTCSITIAGSVGGGTHTIEARASQGSLTWGTIQADATGTYTGTLANVPLGRHVISVRWAGCAGDPCADAAHVAQIGCGVIMAVAGQSNGVGQGQSNQTYTPPPGALPHASEYGGDYAWRFGVADPVGIMSVGSNAGWVDAVNDNSTTAGGSAWPNMLSTLAADAVARKYPVALIPCAKNSSRIADWLPGVDHENRATLYGACVYRAKQASQSDAIEGVLWWQGEGDLADGTAPATYVSRLETIGDAFFADLGAVLIVAKLQNNAGADNTAEGNLRTAVGNAYGTHHIVAGPDLSALDTFDDWHLINDATLISAGSSWAAAVKAGLAL